MPNSLTYATAPVAAPSALKSSQPNKTEIRIRFSQYRSAISPKLRSQLSSQIITKLLSHPSIQQATHICTYISIEPEVDTHSLINQLLYQGKQVSAPVISNQNLLLRQVHSLSQCQLGPKNILIPPETNPLVDPDKINIFVVPGLAFDAFGYRLGYGGGYYDRLLSHTSATKIGICFTDQLTYHLPHESRDIPMNQIITDSITLQFPFLSKKR